MDAIEAVARAVCVSGGYDPDERMPNDGPRWKYYVTGAQAALSAARPFIAAEWQPIETAPKDGSNVLIIAGTAYSPQARVGWWRGDGFAFYSRPDKPSGGGVTIMIEATHWQPLPAPPTAIKETIR